MTAREKAAASTQADRGIEQFIRILVLLRSKGATCRSLARYAGVSKSTMGRWLPGLDAEVSRLGQRNATSSTFPAVETADLSQMGQAAPAPDTDDPLDIPPFLPRRAAP